uniref:Uncharacterized protein n=1 Tax=Rhizophora mucronata TaxID=61149 RepID=A0A2P2QDB6_RHIMU
MKGSGETPNLAMGLKTSKMINGG